MNFLTLTVLICTCLVAPVYLGSPCPPQNQITPCVCNKAGANTIIHCDYHNPKIMELAFKAIASLDMIVDFFNVTSTRLQEVETNFFQGITTRHVMLYGDRWKSIADDAFSDQANSLSILIIKESLLTQVPIKSITELKELESFSMINSEVSSIDSNAFDGLASAPVLMTLDLSANYIKRIGKGAFSNLTALRHLYLMENKLTTLSSDTLPASSRLNVVNLECNRMEEVPSDIVKLPIGASLNLKSNRIRSVDGVSLRTMIRNELIVRLTDNPLKCTCSMNILPLSSVHDISGECEFSRNGGIKKLSDLTAADFSHCLLFRLRRNLIKQLN